jgi:hypothetical protein
MLTFMFLILPRKRLIAIADISPSQQRNDEPGMAVNS